MATLRSLRDTGLRRCKGWLAFLFVLLCSSMLRAQDHGVLDATSFGKSVTLEGHWVAAPGNDPRWADPAFDDRSWVPLERGKPLGRQGFGGARSLWYRTRLQVRPDSPPIAIYIERLSFNYAVYANGELIGQRGGVAGQATTVSQKNEGFAIPERLVRANHGQIVVALHVFGGQVGFLDMPPFNSKTRVELVSPDALGIVESYRMAHDWTEPFAITSLNLLVGLCSLFIWLSLRDQREYLAMTVWVFSNALTALLELMGYLHMAGSVSWEILLLVLVAGISTVAQLEFVRLLLKRPQTGLWMTLEAIAFLIYLLDPLVSMGKLPVAFGAGEVLVRPLITEVFVGYMLLRGAVRGNRDAPVLLLPFALWSATDVYSFLRLSVWFGFKFLIPEPPEVHVFSYTLSTSGLVNTLGLLSLMMIIILRSVRLGQEKADLAAEVAAAEELQLLLLSRASRPTPGYRVETAYRPMQQVGGDFFLVQPCEEDNTLVAIVGDVSGKGLQAAMRVSMILGVLQREVMGQPDRVLQTLNTALLAQGDFGFTTACCVRLEGDGSFCFANAGHLNPYVDGEELNGEGALPLGMDAEAVYPICHGRLERGQRIVLLSDGVLEARTRKGELLGFERVGELVTREVSEIAQAAQSFGQEDDITVLALALA